MMQQVIHKILVISALIIMLVGCAKEEEGNPQISYLRTTYSPDVIEYGSPGQTIAVIGENLGSTREILFNGYPGLFKTTMRTNNSVVVEISENTPTKGPEVTNLVELTNNQGTISYPFKILSAPEILETSPEFAQPGGYLLLVGNNLVNIDTVLFGALIAEIREETEEGLIVLIPEGHTKSPIVLKGASGSDTSKFEFGLDPGVIQNNWGNIRPSGDIWWNGSVLGTDSDFDPLGSPFRYVDGSMGPTWWMYDAGFNFPNNDQRKGVPGTKVMTFEYNLTGDAHGIQFLWNSSHGQYKHVITELETTNGKWVSYSIPMDRFILGDDGPAMTQEVFEADEAVQLQFALINTGSSQINFKYAITNFRFGDR